MGFHLIDRVVSKLDEDQRHTSLISYHGQSEKRLMVSESGVHALLVYHYAPGESNFASVADASSGASFTRRGAVKKY